MRLSECTEICMIVEATDAFLKQVIIQGSAKEWSIGCVKLAPADRGGQDAGITQPRDNFFVIPVDMPCSSDFT